MILGDSIITPKRRILDSGLDELLIQAVSENNELRPVGWNSGACFQSRRRFVVRPAAPGRRAVQAQLTLFSSARKSVGVLPPSNLEGFRRIGMGSAGHSCRTHEPLNAT